MADKKVSALVAINTLSADDLLMVVNDPAGTPESKKVTVGNLFGNVAVSTTHKALTTFTANTNHTGTTATFSANVILTGTGGINAEIDDRMQVANTTLLVNDRMQVANVTSTYTTNTAFQSYVANTNSRVTQTESDFAGTATQITTAILNTPRANTASLIVSTKSTDPATSNAVTESITAGSVFYSNTFLYIATDSNTIKRVALSTF
jgi:hypothetical protein